MFSKSAPFDYKICMPTSTGHAITLKGATLHVESFLEFRVKEIFLYPLKKR